MFWLAIAFSFVKPRNPQQRNILTDYSYQSAARFQRKTILSNTVIFDELRYGRLFKMKRQLDFSKTFDKIPHVCLWRKSQFALVAVVPCVIGSNEDLEQRDDAPDVKNGNWKLTIFSALIRELYRGS